MSLGQLFDCGRLFGVIGMTWVLAACGGGGGGGGSEPASSGPTPTPVTTFVTSGSIGDGPVINAQVVATDANGITLDSGVSDELANYAVDIPSDAALPVTISATGGTDLVTNRPPNFEMVGMAFSSGVQTVNLSPLSTLAIRAAQCAGTVSAAGIEAAWQDVLANRSMGLDRTVIDQPMTDTIDPGNIATIVLANEALGEVIRRTQRSLASSGTPVSHDRVMRVAGCVQAGIDTANTDARIASVLRAAEAQVLLEVLEGALLVDGSDATAAMDASITTIMPQTSGISVASVPVNQALIDQTLNVLLQLNGALEESRLAILAETLAAASPGNVRSRIAARFNTRAENDVAAVVQNMALADQVVVDQVLTRGKQQATVAAPSLEFGASRTTVKAGERVELSWNATGADSCRAAGDWSGDLDASGRFTTAALEFSSVFRLNCAGLGGVVSRSVTVTLEDADPLPELSLSASPLEVDVNGQVQISWETKNATTCRAGGAWSGNKAVRGQQRTSRQRQVGSKTFTMTCSGKGGSVTREVDVLVRQPPPKPLPQLTFSSNVNEVEVGDKVRLTWQAWHADSCQASGAWGGGKAVQGQQQSSALSAPGTRTFRLTCSGDGGEVSRELSVSIRQAAPKQPTLTLSANKQTVRAGRGVNLSWTTQHADTCTAEGDWSGRRPTQGTSWIGNVEKDSTFVLRCTGAGGEVSQSVDVALASGDNSEPPPVDTTPAAPSVTFIADKETVRRGRGVSLSWSSENAETCVAEGDWSGGRATNGSKWVGDIQQDSTFVLRCTGAGGETIETVTVPLRATSTEPEPSQPEPTLTLSANKQTVRAGRGVSLTWASANTTSCVAAGGWSGNKPTSGSNWVGNLEQDTTFTLRCTGPGGDVTQSVEVSLQSDSSGSDPVEPPPEPGPTGEPTVTISVNKATVDSGDNAVVTWSSTNADACQASGAFSGSLTLSGSQTVGPLDAKSNFTVSCSNGQKNAVESVTVNVRSDVEVSWRAPTKNVDGSQLTDLDRYRLYLGRTSGNYTETVNVTNASKKKQTLKLASGKWYIAITAIDSKGDESAHSNEVTKVAP